MRMYRVIQNKSHCDHKSIKKHRLDTQWFDTIAEARAEALELGMPLDSVVQELNIGDKGNLIQTVKNFRSLGSNKQMAKLKVVNLFDYTPE